jgi:hypothetical protein
MKTAAWLVGVAAMVAVTACGKKEEGAAAAATPPTSEGCTAEHTKVDELGFCIKMPPAYTYKGIRNGTNAWWLSSSAADPVMSVDVFQSDGINDLLGDEIGKDGITGTKGDLPGGKWKLSQRGATTSCDVQVNGPKGIIGCGQSGDAKSAAKVCDICKTVRAIK